MYSTNGYFRESLTIFCRFCFKNEGLYPSPESMASLLQGCGNCGSLKLGKEIHGYLIKHGFFPCTIAENSLINMYARNGCEDSALILFRTMAKRDVISWNTIINCFVKNSQPVAALGLLGKIHREGSRDNVYPDFVTLLASLEACSDLALLLQGQVLQSYLTRTGLLGDIFVQNALIDMYAKSGRLDFAENIFKEMHEKDIGSWNSIIAAYGINGNGTSALKVFADLERSETRKPNAITFTNVLSACAHAGLVEEGFKIFNSMEKRHNIRPSTEHYACMVDLLGRAGRVEEAETFIYKMPMQPGPDIWAALLSACVVVGNVTIAEKAAKELAIIEPSSSIWRVALSNAYAAAGKWQEAAEIRAEFRRSKQFVKEGGWSSVNVEGYEFSFMAGDTKHPQSAMIYGIICTLQHHMQDRASIHNNTVLTW
ncbi:Pentatricopeptide repeat-containing protein [Sesamum alatum]|uniref:Pentatricopeptide repeat-containing protein n=1 Tax=Sesamum alatum TaxID=300844 RepID=A0AAE1Y2Q7_9LAMI|nr:Pentatricopeptide repeat-containing protein [Sesamum alatum]